MIKVDSLVRTTSTFDHFRPTVSPLTPDITCKVLQIVNGVAMVIPFNSGHEIMVPIDALVLDE